MVKPGEKVKLSKYDPDDTLGWDKEPQDEIQPGEGSRETRSPAICPLRRTKARPAHRPAGLDAAGKDGTIRHVMSGVNPQGCHVTSFKVPSGEEAAHDFLWRVHKAVPGFGDHRNLQPLPLRRCSRRARSQSRAQSRLVQSATSRSTSLSRFLTQNNVKILKFFLHISKDEQKKRLMERIDDPRQALENFRGGFQRAQILERLYRPPTRMP